MIIIYFFIFIISCVMIFWSGKLLVNGLARIARYLGWKEFVVAFFIIAFAGAIPNLFVGISSALHKIPQLSFGDVVGGNMIDLTIAVALAALIAKGLPAESKVVQSSAVFTVVVAVLPILLILDGTLGRGDGVILISMFCFYVFWMFSKKERFSKVYQEDEVQIIKEFKTFLIDIGKVLLGIIFLLAAAEGMVVSANFFAGSFNLSLPLIGILIIAMGNALPEIYFAVVSAKQKQTGMILGNLMGSIVVPATLVLGIVALLCPIEISDFSPFAIARIFLVISALFFFFFVRTDRKITKKEALFLLGIYVIFVLSEILIK